MLSAASLPLQVAVQRADLAAQLVPALVGVTVLSEAASRLR